jgi:DNA-3-methyladenine glycosylase II
MQTRTGTLKAVEPFDFGRSMDFVAGFGPMTGEQLIEGGAITKALMVGGRTLVFRVKDAGSGSLGYELFSEDVLDEEAVKVVERRISFLFSLDDDVQKFYSIAQGDPQFYPKVKALWGLHHVKFPSLFEVAAWAIITQRIQQPVALKVKQALTENYGGSFYLDGRAYWAFPDHAHLKKATPRELRVLTRNKPTAVRLGSLVKNFEELDENYLLTAPYDKAEGRLRIVQGIGKWSAQFILFRGLGRIEKQEYNTKPLERLMKEVYGPKKKMDEINKVYGKWSGYWQLYLWASTMSRGE